MNPGTLRSASKGKCGGRSGPRRPACLSRGHRIAASRRRGETRRTDSAFLFMTSVSWCRFISQEQSSGFLARQFLYFFSCSFTTMRRGFVMVQMGPEEDCLYQHGNRYCGYFCQTLHHGWSDGGHKQYSRRGCSSAEVILFFFFLGLLDYIPCFDSPVLNILEITEAAQ
jgi:hypothetical protein